MQVHACARALTPDCPPSGAFAHTHSCTDTCMDKHAHAHAPRHMHVHVHGAGAPPDTCGAADAVCPHGDGGRQGAGGPPYNAGGPTFRTLPFPCPRFDLRAADTILECLGRLRATLTRGRLKRQINNYSQSYAHTRFGANLNTSRTM